MSTFSSLGCPDQAAVSGHPSFFGSSDDLITKAIERELSEVPDETFMLVLRQHPLLKACAEDVERACARFEIDPTQPALVRGFLLGMVYQIILAKHRTNTFRRMNTGPRSM